MEFLAFFLLAILLAAVLTGVAIAGKGKGMQGDFSYLLVLGTKVIGTAPSKMLRDRIDAAHRYLTAHPDVICIVSGYQSGEGQISEAECMRRELTAMGIDENRIWIEPNASSTEENILFSWALIEEKTGTRPEKLGILSSESHLLRAEMLASRQGISCVSVSAKTTHMLTFISHFLREIVLVWYYSVIYRRKRI